MGNPNGKVVLVEFMDFACGYCRQSLGDVDRLIAANPDLKVVLRELPILSPESADAAKMALAAAAQGKYGAFHKAMFAAGRPSADTIAAAAHTAGLDPAAAAKTIADPATQAEIESNLTLARAMGLNGTPSWLAGDQMLGGALGYDALAKAVAAARH
jgi:protein-disulfide isomerase